MLTCRRWAGRSRGQGSGNGQVGVDAFVCVRCSDRIHLQPLWYTQARLLRVLSRLEAQRLHPRRPPTIAEPLLERVKLAMEVIRALLLSIGLGDGIVDPGECVVGLRRDVLIDRLVEELDFQRRLHRISQMSICEEGRSAR